MNAHSQPIGVGATFSIEAEQAFLGSLLLNNQIMIRARDIVSPEHFYEPIHAKTFEIIEAMIADGRPATIMTVRPHLAEMSDVDFGEGVTISQYLARLATEMATPILAYEHASVIRDYAMRRKIIEISREAILTSESAPISFKTTSIASDLVSRLDAVASTGIAHNMRRVSIGEAARQAVALANDIRAGKPSRGMLTGISDLDAMIGALERGQGSVLAGRPSMGKTAVAIQIALNTAMRGIGVVYISLEMGGISLAQRILSSILFDDGNGAPVDYSNISQGRFGHRDDERLADAIALLGNVPLEIEQQPSLSASQIFARVRQTKAQLDASGVGLGLVIVDHLGLVAPSSRYKGNRVQEIGEISASMHHLARETDTHCMMLSQLSRRVEERENKRPQLHDLRESGEIEQNADLVLGAYREAYYLSRLGAGMTPEQESQLVSCRNSLEVSVLKNRQGETGAVHLYADMASNAIRGLAR